MQVVELAKVKQGELFLAAPSTAGIASATDLWRAQQGSAEE